MARMQIRRWSSTAVAILELNRGTSLLIEGETSAAVERLSRATRLDPEFPAAWVNLGVALRRTGDLVAAQRAYRRAIEIAPHRVDARHNLALLLNSLLCRMLLLI